MQTSDYEIELAFVQGHQDTGQVTALTRDAWLNIKADLMAKTKASNPYSGLLIYKLPGNAWGCYTGKKRVVKQLTSTLRSFVNGIECLEYWEKQKTLSAHQLQEVDWIPLGIAMQGVPLAQHQWASKHMSGHFAHGKTWCAGNKGLRPDAHAAGWSQKTKTIFFDACMRWPLSNGTPQFTTYQNG